MLIDRRAVGDFMDRRLDDFTWVKRLDRAVIERELRAMRVPPVFKTEPWLHQLACFYLGLSQPYFLYLLDMGLGKTKIHADLITHRIRDKSISRALIAVPRVINIDSWRDDLLLHSDLEPNGCDVSNIEEKRERLLIPQGDVTVIDYSGLHLALCQPKSKRSKKLVRVERWVRMAQRLYGYVGIDESHKLRSSDNLWFWIMSDLTKSARYVYASTGTLFGKNVEGAWSQFYLVDRGDTLGENLGLFRAAFFAVKTTNFKTEFVFRKPLMPELHQMIQHRSLRYDETEVHELPKLVPRVRRVDMGEEQREHYLRALEGLINAGGQVSEMDSAWLRMRQIVSGYLAWKDEHGNHVLRFKQNPKLEALEALLDEMGDSKVVVCYDYTETGRMIVDLVKRLGLGHEWFYGGTRDKTASRRRFMEDPECRVFVMNSEAGGTGNDGLQKVARYMVFYETPTPPDTRKQTVKRIHRPGQRERTFVWDLVMDKSLDKGILDDIAEGIDTHEGVVNGGRRSRGFYLGAGGGKG